MKIADVECRGITFEDEIRAVLCPQNGPAFNWARACIEMGMVQQADLNDPGSVIGRLWWPT